MTFLKEVTMSGIKNLEVPITIQFTNKDVKKRSELINFNVKAIYGPNGSGKTAIVHGFNIFKSLILRPNYLSDDDQTQKLFELLNKKANIIDLNIVFFSEDKSKKKTELNIYTYKVAIKFTNREFVISSECLTYKESEYGQEKIIYKVIDGIIKEYNLVDDKTRFTNLLNKRTLLNLFIHTNITNQFKKDDWVTDLFSLFPVIMLAGDMNVILDSTDLHNHVVNSKNFQKNNLDTYENWIDQIMLDHKVGYNTKKVDKMQLHEIESVAIMKTNFIKLFKPSIKEIIIKKELIEKTSNNQYYKINEYIDYGDYLIDLEFESMGIKKLLNLYEGLANIQNGGITIIDELDSHINDVYLVRLIEFFSEFGKGQLVFTTHNVSPMEILKHKKFSIDFMTQSGKVVSWTQVGNYSPTKLYQKGMINGLPFNLVKDDLLQVFENE